MLVVYYFLLNLIIKAILIGIDLGFEKVYIMLGNKSEYLIMFFAGIPILALLANLCMLLYFPLGTIFHGTISIESKEIKPLFYFCMFVLCIMGGYFLIITWFYSTNLSSSKISGVLKVYYSASVVLGIIGVTAGRERYQAKHM